GNGCIYRKTSRGERRIVPVGQTVCKEYAVNSEAEMGDMLSKSKSGKYYDETGTGKIQVMREAAPGSGGQQGHPTEYKEQRGIRDDRGTAEFALQDRYGKLPTDED